MDENFLIEYIKGTLSEDDTRKVEVWMTQSDDNRQTIENLYLLFFVNNRLAALNEVDVNAAFDEFKQTNPHFARSRGKQNLKTTIWTFKSISIAAISIFAVLSLSFLGIYLFDKNSKPLVVSTRLGERAQIVLPDGSKVWLNACSDLTYKKTFFSHKREAKLNGEAYFEVAPNSTYPFIVSHQGSEIKVLGTKFNVKCNIDEDYFKTTLLEGSILFTNQHEKIAQKLKPNQELIFNKVSHQFQSKNLTNPQEILSWINGKLLFENASLEEIVNSLERHYNVNIQFADEKVKAERFNADFEMADNIYQILSILELTRKFDYEINQRDILISSKLKY